MHKEPPYELPVFQDDNALRLSGLFSPGREGHMALRDGKKTAVRNGNLMRVPAKVFDGVPEPVESFLNERAPVFFVKAVAERPPLAGLCQLPGGWREAERAAPVQGVQFRKEFPLELVPEHVHRDKEAPLGFPDLPVLCKSPAGDYAVEMHVVVHFLVPCVQHLNDARGGAEMARAGGQLEKGLCAASVEKTVQQLLVVQHKGIQLMRECEDHVEIGRVDDFGTPGIHPELLSDGLAVRAVPVTAGIIVVLCVAAVRAGADICAKTSGLAGKDRLGSFYLFAGLVIPQGAVLAVGKFKDLPYITGRHQ